MVGLDQKTPKERVGLGPGGGEAERRLARGGWYFTGQNSGRRQQAWAWTCLQSPFNGFSKLFYFLI